MFLKNDYLYAKEDSIVTWCRSICCFLCYSAILLLAVWRKTNVNSKVTFRNNRRQISLTEKKSHEPGEIKWNFYLSTGGNHPLFFFGWSNHGDAAHGFQDILLFLMVQIKNDAITNVFHVKLYEIYSDSKLNPSTDNKATLAAQNDVILNTTNEYCSRVYAIINYWIKWQ